ncbi:GlxA family transcriptional regulator [Dactylosporangium sp. NPDC048998]|uniref:GlxA family transcriptional regulator n=1 Tax=Dactylosporangium sp. NPDC048998 TaxID=3363976 RepID=UPI00371FE21F
MAAQRVLIVIFEGVQSLDVTGPLEVFAAANLAEGPVRYDIGIASIGGAPVRSSSGLRMLPDVDLAAAGAVDLIIVPGGAGTKIGDPRLVAWLRERAPGAKRLMSVCTGAFLLAEAGLLDGRRATTHWDHCSSLARRFPDVAVDPEPIFVRDGHLSTSAGVTAGIDLALALVEDDLGRDVALAIARQLVMFLRRPGGQLQFSVQLAAQVAARDPLREVQRYAAEHPAADLSVPALAKRANLSPRQFSRAFAAEVGTPPGRYVDRVRLEAARRLLEERRSGVEEIARACGYGTPEAMRRAFVRELGVGPADYRERF